MKKMMQWSLNPAISEFFPPSYVFRLLNHFMELPGGEEQGVSQEYKGIDEKIQTSFSHRSGATNKWGLR